MLTENTHPCENMCERRCAGNQNGAMINRCHRPSEPSPPSHQVNVRTPPPSHRADPAENAALLLLSAEMAGGLAGVLNVIVDYLNTRKQFDRLIGSYQALKHPTAEILLALEAARSHVYHAATLSSLGSSSGSSSGESAQKYEIALRMAKAHSSESFAHAGDRAVQFHGGFGFTYECDAQLYLRRALWCQYQYGDERYHRQKLAPLLID